MNYRSAKDILVGALRRLSADRITLTAAGMAFYWFLAVFPLLLAMIGLLGLTDLEPDAVSSINRAINTALPADAAEVLTGTLSDTVGERSGHSGTALVVGLGVALWSASAGMGALQAGLDIVYRVPGDRPVLRKRARALLLVLTTVVLGALATALIIFGGPLGEGIDHHLPFGGAVFVPVWTVVRWLVGITALAALFAAIYFFGPNQPRPRWAWFSPGGFVGAGIWLVGSVGFSYYVTGLGDYGRNYGSLTGVVVLLLWFYLTALAILLGGEINASLERK